ncbi:MAG: GntR family transcriptional regulator [Gammaproteobacteria bacterium]|jgi:DNA-binding GntR family transcriptional regulator|nr:GntR family transcriptional regulator [Gammaproteobacteria bacterium]MBU0787608.1 GntR family transcriptional regulator [Gammaproteobacteria bacterium]MBU0814922.1 GntR family transcriptional regulator [Gammaproteobacteria bacterium]MBU1785970.1 GntR family transcriptional regulator [Gammaproteobacteria bacterium]
MPRKPALVTTTADASGTTRASAVYDALRADILHGVLKPDEKLKVDAVGERYSVGASPVREALNRLSSEGLVTRNDQRGFSVAPLHWSELAILTDTRCQVEAIALRESIIARDAAWEDALVLLVHKLSRSPRSLATDRYVPNPEWESLHQEFHAQLLANCPSRWLRDFCNTLSHEAYRYRQVAASKNFMSRKAHQEHVALFHAAIEGKADEAVHLLTDHYRRTSDSLRENARRMQIS